MKSLTRVFAKELLLAALFTIAPVGFLATSASLGQSPFAAAQEMANSTTPTNATQTNATEIATSNNTLGGTIASQQLNEAGAPQWVAGGYWQIKSDGPIFGGNNQTQPTVNSFDAVVDMAQLDDGTFLHGHTFSNFRQSDIGFTSENATTINGTMTVTTEDGPTEDIPAYIILQNSLITIYPNPGAVDNHFGPTPIHGLVLTTEKLQEISDLLMSSIGSTNATETAAEGQEQNSTSLTSDVGNATAG